MVRQAHDTITPPKRYPCRNLRLRFRLCKTKPTTLHYLCPVTYLTSSNANDQAATGGLDDTDQPLTHPAVYLALSQLFIELNHL
jgi:hypothetical protein